TEDGESVSQIVEITVTGEEDGPVITGGATGDVEEDGTQTATGSLSVTDADATDDPAFTAQEGTEGTLGTFDVTVDGVWTYTLDNAAAQVLAGGEEFTETFTVFATTEDGESVSQIVEITVTGEEDGPVITGTATGDVEEDGTQSASGTLFVSDADATDDPTFTAQEGTEGAYGTFEVTVGGVWTYTLDNAAAQALAGGQVVEETFTVTAVTADEESVSRTVTIVVTGEEDAPTISGTSSGAVAEDGTLSTTGALTVSDADENDSPSFTAQSGTAGLYGTFFVTTAGAWTYTLNNALAQALSGTDIASETFEVEATTTDGETVTQTVTISVAGEEDAPIIAGTASGAVYEDEVFSVTGALTVTDADANDTPAFTAQENAEGAYGTFSIDSTGNWTYTLDNAAAQALERDETVIETFTVQATTADGESVSQVVSITVTGTNEAPTVPDVVLVANLTNNSGFENGFLDWQQIAGPQVGPNGEYIDNSYNYSFVIDDTGELIDGDNFVADISFSGWLDQWNDGPNRGTVFGPSLISNEFVGYAGDIVTFVYRPFAGGDAASITAVLINVDTGERTLVFFEETPVGGSSATKFIDVPISEEGNFQIEFIVGSFDATDGGFVGARLVIGTAGIIREGVQEGESQTFEPIQFLGSATDPESDTLSVSSVQTFSAGGATVSIDGDGNILYETGTAFDYLNAGQTVTDTFTFTVSDGNGGITTATASIDVVGTGSSEEGEALSYAPVANETARSESNSSPVPIETTGTALSVNDPLTSGTVTYSFLPGAQSGSGITAYSAAQQAAAIAALALWAEISGLTIAEAGDGESATIRFLNSTGETYAATFDSSYGSTIVTNPDYLETQAPANGTYGFLTLLHETGHALGLEHATGDLTHAQSIMSWQSPDILGVDWYNSQGNWIYAQTPMIEDIAAIQATYGSNPVTRSGDTVYGFNSSEAGTLYDFSANSDPVLTIYDAGGVDALDFSGWDAPALINLNPGSYSSVNGMTNNIGIAFGTIIEKAIGGAGDDVLIGTARAETLDGGAGRDTLTGGSGADTFVIAHSDLADVIVDFEVGVDRLDLQALLAANFGEEDLEDYIQVSRDGADVVIQVDQDGTGKTSDFKDVAVLQSIEAGGIIDFVFSDNGVQNTDAVVA
ncbi:MAG: VCBS domain-containing protein, partial [Roseibium sp.]|uniref:VCBS domain-containing protein n=1 Tax=Roseibium sp. TaxID=1936156 RepID=UPI002639832B